MRTRHNDDLTNCRTEDRSLVHAAAQSAELFHLVSVGTIERGCFVNDALFGGPGARLSVVTTSTQLWEMPEHDVIHLAILHDTLSSSELEESSRLIRRRWPQARILVIRAGEEFLEDALYDDRAAPSISSEALLTRIEEILARVSRGEQDRSS
jgi:hypothetical protein